MKRFKRVISSVFGGKAQTEESKQTSTSREPVSSATIGGQVPPQEPIIPPPTDAHMQHGASDIATLSEPADLALTLDLEIDEEREVEEDPASGDDNGDIIVTLPPETGYHEAVPYSADMPTDEAGRLFPLPETRHSNVVPYSASIPILDEPESLQAGSETSGSRSYLSFVPRTIQQIDSKSTLFVWHATFHPGLGRRFDSAVLSVRFATATAVGKNVPKVTAHAPHKSYGGVTKEEKKLTWGLELPLTFTAGGAVDVGITPNTSHETGKTVEHAFTIAGSARGVPYPSSCVWTIEQNSSSKRGIPPEVQFATVVEHHESSIAVEVDVSARTSGGYLPPHWLRVKSGNDAIRRRVICPEKMKGRLYEYNIKHGHHGVDKLLKSWTGEVEGSQIEFGQGVHSA